jgi:hypothetical protein
MAVDKPLRPFQNESDSRQIGDLTIENRTDRVDIYGSLSITRDKAGLAAAVALKQAIDAAVDVLKSEKLPERFSEVPSKTVPNPFKPKS